jgi:hypothetical protein
MRKNKGESISNSKLLKNAILAATLGRKLL